MEVTPRGYAGIERRADTERDGAAVSFNFSMIFFFS